MRHRTAAFAALAIAAVVLSGCAGADSSRTTTATTIAPTTTTTAAATTTSSTTTTTAIVVTTTTPGLIIAPTFVVPFQMTATGVLLVKNMEIADGWIDYRAGSNQYVVFTVGGPGSVDAWVEFLTTDGRIEGPEEDFDEFAAAVDDSLATLKWNPAG